MKRSVILVLLVSALLQSRSQPYPFPLPAYTPSQSNIEYREKFRDMKFGLFIHWGIYSLMGDGEWVMHNRKIPYQDYKRLADFFNPVDFDAKAWVQMAKNAGMKYITITSRHHDGFSMFRTNASPYNIVDGSPYKKDILKELAGEAAKEGIEIHFYYSLVDWGRQDYGFGKKIVNTKPENTDWDSYIRFMKTQLNELITQYPNVKCIWFDGHWERREANWHYDEIYSLIHQLNPSILVGNNHHMPPLPGEDLQMFEKDLPGENRTGFRKDNSVGRLPLETCETINNSWGFNINDRNHKTSRQIIHLLVQSAGRNANLLLNVGPMPNGKIQTEFTDTLAKVGKWMEKFGETVYGTRGGDIMPQDWGVVTSKGKTLYVHLLKRPNAGYVFLPGLTAGVSSAKEFTTGKAIRFKQQQEGVFIYLDELVQDEIDTIIRLELK
jgi:alpha-L-fucosidase